MYFDFLNNFLVGVVKTIFKTNLGKRVGTAGHICLWTPRQILSQPKLRRQNRPEVEAEYQTLKGKLQSKKYTRGTQGVHKEYTRITQGLHMEYTRSTQGVHKEYNLCVMFSETFC